MHSGDCVSTPLPSAESLFRQTDKIPHSLTSFLYLQWHWCCFGICWWMNEWMGGRRRRQFHSTLLHTLFTKSTPPKPPSTHHTIAYRLVNRNGPQLIIPRSSPFYRAVQWVTLHFNAECQLNFRSIIMKSNPPTTIKVTIDQLTTTTTP